MLHVDVISHRQYLMARMDNEQKLFVLIRCIPDAALMHSRSPIRIVLVVDTSSSMREEIEDGVTKLERAVQYAKALVDDPRLEPTDQMAVVQFDSDSRTLLGLTPVDRRQEIHRSMDRLEQHDGGTMMAVGLRNATSILSGEPVETVKRVVVLTDGETFDEAECLRVASSLADRNAPLIALGVGDEYNHELLARLADDTGGRPYHLTEMADFQSSMNEELNASIGEVVTNLRVSVSGVKGVALDRLTRIHPGVAEVQRARQPYALGNIRAGDSTDYVAELTISGSPRPPSRARLAQVGFSFEVPGLRRHEELPPRDLWVTFTDDARASAQTEPTVMEAVKKRNVDQLVQQAVRQATVDAEQAGQTLQQAIGMTERSGNTQATLLLQSAVQELERTGTLSAETQRTVRLGAKTRTMSGSSGAAATGISEEEIRKHSGT
jgi:Ca-activated chloride channel family protein